MSGTGFGISDGSGGFVSKLEADGDAKIGDSSGDVIQITGSIEMNENIFFTNNGRIGIGDSDPSFKLSVGGSMEIGQYVYHKGDNNTFINFTDNRVRINAGGNNHIDCEDKSSAPHKVRINNGGNNIDFVIKDNSNNVYFIADASTSRVGIGTDTPSTTLDVAGDVNFDGSAVFNESSADKDFRVESNNAENMFFVDGGSNRIGIGTGTPIHTIDIQERSGVEAVLRIMGDSDVGIRLAADSDNSGENDNPYIDFYQDGQNSNSRNNRLASLAMEGDAAATFTGSLANAVFIDAFCPGAINSNLRTIQFANDSSNNGHAARITIEGTNGYVGIHTSTPSKELEVNGTTKSNYYVTTPTTQDLGSGTSSTLSIGSSLMFLDADSITGQDLGIGMDVHTLNIPNGTTSGQKLTLVIEGNMGAGNSVGIMVAGNLAGASDMFMPSAKTSLNFVYYSTASISAWYQV